jgi:hypothetical protein
VSCDHGLLPRSSLPRGRRDSIAAAVLHRLRDLCEGPSCHGRRFGSSTHLTLFDVREGEVSPTTEPGGGVPGDEQGRPGKEYCH